ncbi:hypothetical protein L228DRAFT_249662 [Xylona heveae TC161]|uniref:ferric-chelate reductase (NADPH) n=1 Tax=Xylona heveae (strain CBS 132557 / TC161) TaxID=1328760 RepID=A0A165FD48_XYLHT|nr:hypothetical protein L228DRAFT_249662 [Xylona heveae TC161]KZF20844.1 hypothetical protein L228DRAFT_249662 [Xylona heveae TC161]
MDMDMGDMSGGMSMGDGVPTLFHMQKMYWAFIGATIGFATLVHMGEKALCWQRLHAASKQDPTPAKPRSPALVAVATATAIIREISNATMAMFKIRGRTFRSAPLGRICLVLAYFVLLVVLCFYRLQPSNPWQYEDVAYRCAYISVAQLPLIFLLAGKNNIVGWMTGLSYERINWLHRWVARCLLFTTTLHMGYFFTDWARYDYILIKLRTDSMTQTGISAWAILVWIVLSSFAPIRGLSYELFVLQHLISFVAFITMVMLHADADVHVYIWIPVGLFFFDRITRALYVLYTNLAIFHPKARREGNQSRFWACKASFTPVSQRTTRVTIQNPPIQWKAGQHVFLSCHSIVPLQSHPFTVASLPEDGKMEFLIRAGNGGTKAFFHHAEKHHQQLPTTEAEISMPKHKSVAIEGPYGRIRPLRQFDTVVLLAGSTGATFTVPLMREIVSAWRRNNNNNSDSSDSSRQKRGFLLPDGIVTRHIRFVWVIKARDQLDWLWKQLITAIDDVRQLRHQGIDVELDMSIYITCDDSLTSDQQGGVLPPASARNSLPPPYGVVEEVHTAKPEKDEKKSDPMFGSAEKAEVRELDSLSMASSHQGPSSGRPTCGPNGTCCCTATIEDEDAIDNADAPVCTCNCGAAAASLPEPTGPAPPSSSGTDKPHSSSPPPLSPSSDGTAAVQDFEKAQLAKEIGPRPDSASSSLASPTSPTSIPLFSGRPSPRTIIRKSLEQAFGESAVVVCGPCGLVDDVRHSVVSLSDERAVHKGSGAQGIYLHTEAFGY